MLSDIERRTNRDETQPGSERIKTDLSQDSKENISEAKKDSLEKSSIRHSASKPMIIEEPVEEISESGGDRLALSESIWMGGKQNISEAITVDVGESGGDKVAQNDSIWMGKRNASEAKICDDIQ